MSPRASKVLVNPGTATLPRALLLDLIRAAYWPTVRAEAGQLVKDPAAAADLAENRCQELDDWVCRIGGTLPDDGRTAEAFLAALQAAWAKGDRP